MDKRFKIFVITLGVKMDAASAKIRCPKRNSKKMFEK